MRPAEHMRLAARHLWERTHPRLPSLGARALAWLEKPVDASMIWAVLLALAAFIASRAHYTADLSAFLPRTPTATERLLVDQLREGLASRLISVEIEGADGAARAQISAALARRLRSDARFVSIQNGDAAELAAEQRFLFDHRYLLSDAVTPERFTVEGLRNAVEDTLDLLAGPAGMLVKPLLRRDPTGEMVQIIDQLGGTAPRTDHGVWSSRDGQRALLLAQTSAQGSDTDGQEQAVQAIHDAFSAALAGLPAPARRSLSLHMTGPGVFAVEARARIKDEVIRLSALSTLLVVTLLLAVYRSVPALVLGLVPVASGALAGVAAVALGFGVVHGITLGFGITLIGEVVDYSIYLLIQSQQRGRGDRWQHSVWPTLRLGMLTSVCGFASLLPSGFPGLAQLGLYSIAGLLAGAAVTRFVLPSWLPGNLRMRDLTPLGRFLGGLARQASPARPFLLIVPLLAGAILYVHRDHLWSRDLAALSPVPQAEEALDSQTHADLGSPDTGYLVALSGPDRESVLRAAEHAGTRLDQLADAGVIGGFLSPAQYLPSVQAQEARQASLPSEAQLRTRLAEALAGLPLSPTRIGPFIRDVEAARSAPLITPEDLAHTPLGAAVGALLFQSAGRWHALLPLKAPPLDHACPSAARDTGCIDVPRIEQALSGEPGQPLVLGMKDAANQMYTTYLNEAVTYSLTGFLAIVLLLFLTLRSPVRVLRVVAPLGLAVLTVVSVLALLGVQLTILHVIGLLLIVAVGSNYALFFDRRAADTSEGSPPLTLASLAVANVATVMTFSVLAFSSVPVLSALGSTVAPGTLLALIFSAVLARHPPELSRTERIFLQRSCPYA